MVSSFAFVFFLRREGALKGYTFPVPEYESPSFPSERTGRYELIFLSAS
jgi:hypothetical protein